MFNNIKSKLFTVVLIACAAMLISIPAFAANSLSDVTATAYDGTKYTALSDSAEKAARASKADLITVETTISTPGADVTVLVLDASIDITKDAIADTDIKYIDQMSSREDNGKASVTFRMPLTADATTYAIYIGGDSVLTPSVKYFRLKAAGVLYVSGDIDSSEEVDITDAIYILRSTVGYTAPEGIVWDMDAADVNNDDEIDISDAIYILRYTVGYPSPDGVSVGEEVSSQ